MKKLISENIRGNPDHRKVVLDIVGNEQTVEELANLEDSWLEDGTISKQGYQSGGPIISYVKKQYSGEKGIKEITQDEVIGRLGFLRKYEHERQVDYDAFLHSVTNKLISLSNNNRKLLNKIIQKWQNVEDRDWIDDVTRENLQSKLTDVAADQARRGSNQPKFDPSELVYNRVPYKIYSIKKFVPGKMGPHLSTDKMEPQHASMVGSKWCIRFQDYFDRYLARGPIFVITKDDRLLGAYNQNDGTIRNINDDPLVSDLDIGVFCFLLKSEVIQSMTITSLSGSFKNKFFRWVIENWQGVGHTYMRLILNALEDNHYYSNTDSFWKFGIYKWIDTDIVKSLLDKMPPRSSISIGGLLEKLRVGRTNAEMDELTDILLYNNFYVDGYALGGAIVNYILGDDKMTLSRIAKYGQPDIDMIVKVVSLDNETKMSLANKGQLDYASASNELLDRLIKEYGYIVDARKSVSDIGVLLDIAMEEEQPDQILQWVDFCRSRGSTIRSGDSLSSMIYSIVYDINARKNWKKVIGLAIQYGISYDNNTLDYALQTRIRSLINTVIDLGAKKCSKYTLPLAIRTGNLHIVRKIMDLGVVPTKSDITLARSINMKMLDIIKPDVLQKRGMRKVAEPAIETESISKIARLLSEDIHVNNGLMESVNKSYTLDELNNVQSRSALDVDRIRNKYGTSFRLTPNSGGSPEGGNFIGGVIPVDPPKEDFAGDQLPSEDEWGKDISDIDPWRGNKELDELYQRLIHITGYDDLIAQGKTPEEADKIMKSFWNLTSVDIGSSTPDDLDFIKNKYGPFELTPYFMWEMKNCKMIAQRMILLPDGSSQVVYSDEP